MGIDTHTDIHTLSEQISQELILTFEFKGPLKFWFNVTVAGIPQACSFW